MNLEEAIKHLEATLEDSTHIWSCENCKEEHEQLLTWLLELRSLRAQQEENKSNALLAQYAAQKFQESMTDFKEIQRLKTQLAALWNMEKNDPLTLDELREMDGEPVYIVECPDWGHWELSENAEDYLEGRDPHFYGMKLNDPAGRYGLHKSGWLAYRRKQEEGAEIGVAKDKDVPTKFAIMRRQDGSGGIKNRPGETPENSV